MEQTPSLPIEGETLAYPAKARWLICGAALIGCMFAALVESPYEWAYGAFWLCALLVFVLFNARRIASNKTALIIGVPAFLYAAAFCVPALVNDWMYPAIPLTMMLFAVVSTQDVPVGREDAAIVGVLLGVAVKPFTAIGKCFGAIGSLVVGKRASTARRVGMGLLIGLPLTAAVLLLLVSADAGMERLMSGIFARFDVGAWMRRVVLSLVSAILFYSLFYNLTLGKRDALKPPAKKNWLPLSPAIVISLLLLVYAVFACVQFSYLFGGALPQESTYSGYAREGFSQLVCVSIINFTVLGVCLVKCEKKRALTTFFALLLVFTLGLLVSAAWRLLLYIGAYGLTIKRILPLWLMAYLVFLCGLTAVRVFREKTPAMRIAGIAFLYWYLAFCLVDWQSVITAYNGGFSSLV